MGKKIVQFAYNKVSPDFVEGKSVIDCRVLRNPFRPGFSDDALKGQVRISIGFYEKVREALRALEVTDVIYIGCTHGKHRSGAVADEVHYLTGVEVERL